MNRVPLRLAAGGTAVAVAIALAGCTAGGGDTGGEDAGFEAANLQLATYLSPTTPYGEAIQWFVDEASARTDGAVNIEVFWEGALLPGADILGGVAQGRAELGFTTPLYHPAELPLSQIVSVPFLTGDAAAVQAALTELANTNADYQAEWESAGVRPLAIQAVSPNIMVTLEPLDNLDDLEGRSLRATSLIAAAVQASGGNAVALTLPEIYESISRGLIQGATSLNLGSIPSISLQEVAKYVTDPGSGIYSDTALFINPSTYDGLPEATQVLIDELSVEFNQQYLDLLGASESAACDTMLEDGAVFSTWSEADSEEWKDALGDDISQQWIDAADAAGVDGEAFMEEYLQLVEDNASDYVSGISECASR